MLNVTTVNYSDLLATVLAGYTLLENMFTLLLFTIKIKLLKCFKNTF